VVDWLEGAAAWRLAELAEPVDEVVPEDEVVAEVDAATVVVVVPLLAEDTPPGESSSQPVRAMALATLAAAAIRRPLQAG